MTERKRRSSESSTSQTGAKSTNRRRRNWRDQPVKAVKQKPPRKTYKELRQEEIYGAFKYWGDRGLPDWEAKAEFIEGLNPHFADADMCFGVWLHTYDLESEALAEVWRDIAETVGERCSLSGEAIVAYPTDKGWQVVRSGRGFDSWCRIYKYEAHGLARLEMYPNRSKALLEARRLIKFQYARVALHGFFASYQKTKRFKLAFPDYVKGMTLTSLMHFKDPIEFWSR